MSEPTYPGPKTLHTALSALHVERGERAVFQREGLRADSEYRDLGLAAATGGKLGVKHIRAIARFEQPTGWHWHDMHAHFIYVLRGWITFGFAGVDEQLTLRAGDSLSQPAGVPHNVIARSEDFEVLELNVPAEYGTFDLPKGGR
jgi:mannose-6-phosphate isomerase-like protein (cupin superfamily)